MLEERKGQGVMFDSLMSVMVFMFLFLTLLSLWSANLKVVEKNDSFNDMRQAAFQASEFLLRSGGYPESWESDIADANRVGIASRDRVIDSDKLSAFQQLASDDYNRARELLLLGNYDFLFELGPAFSVGKAVESDAEAVVIRRVVYYSGSDTVAELTVFKT